MWSNVMKHNKMQSGRPKGGGEGRQAVMHEEDRRMYICREHIFHPTFQRPHKLPIQCSCTCGLPTSRSDRTIPLDLERPYPTLKEEHQSGSVTITHPKTLLEIRRPASQPALVQHRPLPTSPQSYYQWLDHVRLGKF